VITNAFATTSIFATGRGSVGESTLKHFEGIKAGIDVKFGRASGERAGGSGIPIPNEWAD
jgi:hypothetical protein